MSQYLPASRTTATAVATSNSAETTIATSAAVSSGQGAAGPGASIPAVRITGVLNITTGASTTAVVVRVRQGAGTGGTLLAVAQTHTIAAAASGNIAFAVTDTSGWAQQAGGGQYTVTVAQTSGAGAGTVNLIDFVVEELV